MQGGKHRVRLDLIVLSSLQTFLKVLSFDESKIDQLRLASAKLQPDAGRAAQKLMDVLFTTEEMVNGNPSGNSKSRDATRLATISPLDPARMKYIFGKCVLCRMSVCMCVCVCYASFLDSCCMCASIFWYCMCMLCFPPLSPCKHFLHAK